jgi:hypothetical protein
MSVINVNVTNAGSANVSVSNGSTVSATVGNGGVVNVSTGTISPGNATVVSGTLTINSTTTLAAGQAAYVKNDAGTAYAAKLDIGIPAGPATLVSVGETTTLASGSNATVTGSVSGSNLTLAFGIPRGVTPSIAIGNVTTSAAGSSASVVATTTNSGANVTLDLTIPRGDPGTSGSNGTNGTTITLSDATPSNLGTASAGSSNLAARADHVHSLPSLSTLGAAASNHAHPYVTGLNNLTGALTLAAGPNVTITSNSSTLTIDSKAGLDGNTVIDGGNYVGEIIYSGTITITQQPTNQTAVSNAATFSVAAQVSPTGTLGYQWQRSDNNGSTWLTVSNATASSVSLSGLTVASDNNDRYRVVVSASGASSVTSNAATLTVPTNPDGDGTAASPWVIRNVGPFSSKQFSATTSGTLYMTYGLSRSGSGSSQYGVLVSRSRSGTTQTAIEIAGTLSTLYGQTASQSVSFAANDGIFVEALGSVNVDSIDLWIA